MGIRPIQSATSFHRTSCIWLEVGAVQDTCASRWHMRNQRRSQDIVADLPMPCPEATEIHLWAFRAMPRRTAVRMTNCCQVKCLPAFSSSRPIGTKSDAWMSLSRSSRIAFATSSRRPGRIGWRVRPHILNTKYSGSAWNRAISSLSSLGLGIVVLQQAVVEAVVAAQRGYQGEGPADLLLLRRERPAELVPHL